MLYERSNPFYEHVAGGLLDMTECEYKQYDPKTCAITGPKFIPIEGKVKVSLQKVLARSVKDISVLPESEILI